MIKARFKRLIIICVLINTYFQNLFLISFISLLRIKYVWNKISYFVYLKSYVAPVVYNFYIIALMD